MKIFFKYMHRIVYSISFSLIFLTNLNFASVLSHWKLITSPTDKDLKNCFFVDKNNGWISGDSGTIIHTTDGGKNWIVQNTNTNKDIRSLFFINKRLGWSLAWELKPDTLSYTGTLIFKTTNGGTDWNQTMYADTNVFMNSVYFVDSLKGFLGGAPEFIHYTIDAGNNWFQSHVDSAVFNGVPVNKIVFFDEQFGYASGGSRDFVGSVWTTTNSGLNWKQKILGVDPINDLYLVSRDSVFGTGGDFKFGANYFSTSDFSQNWLTYALGFAGIATAIDFRTKYEGWIALGSSELLFYSLDGGVNWITENTPDSTAIFDITFTDSISGWAVGKDGVILKYDLLTKQNNNNELRLISENFLLYQNYPNPFNPKTIINYELPITNFVSIKVYNNLGKEVALLVNQKQNSGSHKIEFDGSDLPSGLYFYILKIEKINSSEVLFYESKKMVLIK
ncbi:MAG: YCF48-related protein [Ignavibacteria bacterium]